VSLKMNISITISIVWQMMLSVVSLLFSSSVSLIIIVIMNPGNSNILPSV